MVNVNLFDCFIDLQLILIVNINITVVKHKYNVCVRVEYICVCGGLLTHIIHARTEK